MPWNTSERNVRIRNTENNGKLIRFESFLSDHVDQAALFIIVSAFLIYFYYGTRYYLNPDEAFNFYVSKKLTGLSVWGALGTSAAYDPAHPPLLVFLLHLFMKLWNSVFALRFLTAAFSAAALWFAFKWVQHTFGSVEALIALLLFAFSPAMVSIAYQLRDYAAVLFFICGAVYFLSFLLEKGSLWSGVAFSLFLYGAILSHFSAAWIVITLGIYAAVFLLLKKPGWRIVALWGVSQAGAMALYAFLYITHVRGMLKSGYAEFNIQGFLKRRYFFPDEESLTSFLIRSNLDLFTYFSGGKLAGIIALICFLLGIIYILFKRSRGAENKGIRYVAIVLALPFIFGCMGAVFRVMPYGGSRHVSYLIPFASTAIALCFVRVFSLKRMSAALMAGVILVPLWLTGSPPPSASPGMSSVHMREALKWLNESVKANEIIFVDDMTHHVLAYYLARDQETIEHSKQGTVYEHSIGNYRIISMLPFSFSPENFEKELVAMSQSMGIRPGDFVWVMTVGWGGSKPFNAYLAKYPLERIKEHLNFGPITLIQISIPRGLPPAIVSGQVRV